MDASQAFIGFRVAALKRFHVVYIDSERNQNDQFPYAVQRIKIRAGFQKTDKPANLETVSLINIERMERFEAVSQYLEDVRLKHPNELIIVILDVITDCIGSFNDPRETMKLLDHLNVSINQHNIAYICVIHENPNNFGEGKARGHLGTELINKATTVISIGYSKAANGNNTDLIEVKFLHTRNTKKPDHHYLKYSDEADGLVVADSDFISAEKSRKAEKATIPQLKAWLSENITCEISKTDLVAQLKEHFECSDRTIEDRLKILADPSSGFLSVSKKGKEVYYCFT